MGLAACASGVKRCAFNRMLIGVWHTSNMWRILLIFVLAACGAQPAPEFFGAKRVDVARDGWDYTVYFTEKRVEVIRSGYAVHGQHHDIREVMIRLIPEVTGCKLVDQTLQGDSGEMRGSIRC